MQSIIYYLFSIKEREVHATVHPSLHKVRMSLETVFLSVFQNKEAVFFQQIVSEDEVGQGFQPGKLVGRIGKDKVELLASALDVFEYVTPYGQALVCL